MTNSSRLFDSIDLQLEKFPKEDMLVAKENGQWKKYGTAQSKAIIDNFSAGLLALGLSGNDMTAEGQDKVALISNNRPEWVFTDLACQQVGVPICPIYPTTNPSKRRNAVV
jgi:long-chain acyl-CoA synthetase